MLIDFGPLYTTTGNIHQLEYAQKCANNGSTCIAFKYKTGVIIATEKPIESVLYKNTQRIKKVTPNIFMTYSGLLTDGGCLFEYVKNSLHGEMLTMEELISPGRLSYQVSEFLSYFNTKHGCRPVGCSFITGLVYKNKYYLVKSEPTASSLFCEGTAIGKGMQRAKTELEKLDLEEMSFESAVENGVKILYQSYDPLKDKDFEIEMCYVGIESGNEIANVDKEMINRFVEKYKDLSIDE
ncbi:putative proteasome subunit alpha type-7 [Conglomerata obtusa]